MLFERADGILIRFKHSPSKRGIDIATLDLATNHVHGWSLPIEDYERLFELNVDLMNPNRIEDRCKWIAQRIQIPSGSNTHASAFLISPDVVAKLIDVELDHSFKLPMGKMSPEERQRIHREITSSDGKRAANIESRERQRIQLAVDATKSVRERSKESAIAVEGQMKTALDCCFKEVSEKKQHEDHLILKRRELDERREISIRNREIERIEREERWLEEIRETKADMARSNQENILRWRKNRDELRIVSADEEARFKSTMKHLEEKRQAAYDARELRWKVKADEYVKSRAEYIKASQRKLIIIREKKLAQAFDLFSTQPIPN